MNRRLVEPKARPLPDGLYCAVVATEYAGTWSERIVPGYERTTELLALMAAEMYANFTDEWR